MSIETKPILITAPKEQEVQRRDIIAGFGSTGGILALCIAKFRNLFSVNRLGRFQKTSKKEEA